MAVQEKIELSLKLSPQLYATLDTLAQKIGTDKADVLRQAIALLQVAVEALEQGKEMAIVDRQEISQQKSE